MISSIFRSIGGGFGRVLGRCLGLIFIGFIIYCVINYLDIDIKSIIPKINLGGVLY